MTKIGILGSTKGTDLEAIVSSIKSGNLNAHISIVVSNVKNAYILQRAKKHSIPSVFICHKNKKRSAFDSQVSSVLKKHGVNVVLLIGFMRILSNKFCREWKNVVLNVHPSLLPKYAGGMDTDIHKNVIKNREKETGCTVHLVTEYLDEGPVLIQKSCSVDEKETVASLKKKVQSLEGEALVESIKLIQKKNVTRSKVK